MKFQVNFSEITKDTLGEFKFKFQGTFWVNSMGVSVEILRIF